jgi:hypothetical protein
MLLIKLLFAVLFKHSSFWPLADVKPMQSKFIATTFYFNELKKFLFNTPKKLKQ